MGLNTVQLETTIWILIVGFFLIFVNLLFYFCKSIFAGEQNRSGGHGESMNPMQAGEKGEEDVYVPSRYAIRDSVEVTFDDKENNRFYSTCSNDDIIKVTTIWSMTGEQTKIAYNEAYDIVSGTPAVEATAPDGRETIVAEGTERSIELYKPLGLELAEDDKGQVFIKAIDRGSRADKSGIVFVGDFIRKLSANVGEELWNCETAGLATVLNHIRTGNAPTVKLVLEASNLEEEKHRRRIAFVKPPPRKPLKLIPDFLKVHCILSLSLSRFFIAPIYFSSVFLLGSYCKHCGREKCLYGSLCDCAFEYGDAY